MVRASFPGVNKVYKTLADGNKRTYYYHRWTKRRLKGKPGDACFAASYAEAEASYTQRDRNTLAGLMRQYSNSLKFDRLADSTKADRRRLMRKIEDKFGTLPIAAIEDRRVRADFLQWRDEIAKNSPREADNRLTTLQAILSWAHDRGLIDRHPLERFERVYKSDRSDKVWMPDDIKRFMGKANIGMQRALILALHTGQRQGDLLRLTWNNYDGSYIRLRQGKTKTLVEIPCTKALRDMLDNMPREAATILLSATGQPWKSKNFQHRWKDVMIAAKIDGLHFHDLRGTAVTMLAEAECTAPQIAAITGHSLRHVSDILDKYLAKTRTLADQAMDKFENAHGTEFANQLQTKAHK